MSTTSDQALLVHRQDGTIRVLFPDSKTAKVEALDDVINHGARIQVITSGDVINLNGQQG